jgi:hypothetical protein
MVLAVCLGSTGAHGLADQGSPRGDLLSAEIQRWSSYLEANDASDEISTGVRQSARPVLERATQALKDGRRLLALQRLAAARELLAAAEYVAQQPGRNDAAAFEAEWARAGKELSTGVASARGSRLPGLRTAALRALAESALAQVKVYHDASLEYGRNTTPQAGFFYLGTARAQLALVDLLVSLSATVDVPTARSVTPRSVQPELDALERQLLAAYRPPVSIDRHGEFIAASARLKEARELDAAGQHHGALLRYLQAAQRVAPLVRPSSAPADAAATAATIDRWQATLSKGGIDHSIGRLFVQEAESAVLDAKPAAGGPDSAAIIVDDVLPRYLTALEPGRPAQAGPAAAVTVTLVRWPYT